MVLADEAVEPEPESGPSDGETTHVESPDGEGLGLEDCSGDECDDHNSIRSDVANMGSKDVCSSVAGLVQL